MLGKAKSRFLPDSSSALDHIPDCDAIVGERRKQDLDGHLRLVNAGEENPGNPNRMGISRRVILFGCTSFCLRHSAFSQTAFVKLPWRHTAFGTYYIEDKLPFCHMTLRTNYILVFLSSVHIAFKTRGGGGEQSQFFMDETDTKKLLTI